MITARVSCDVPITPMGWRIPPDSKTNESEDFICPKCDEGVPGMYVYREMEKKEAERLMKAWMK